MQRIDVHRHYIPQFLIDDARAGRAIAGLRIEGDTVMHRQRYHYFLDPEFHLLDRIIADLDETGVDHAVLGPTPTLFFYDVDAQSAADFCAKANDWITKLAAESGGRVSGMATVPMQDPEAAARELRRCVEDLGIRSVEIGTDIEGVPLDDARYRPVFDVAEELEVLVLLHPYFVGPRPGLEDFYMTNLVGLPFLTAVAATRLLLSGFFTRHDVRFVLVHGGGYLPYQLGRLDRGYLVREESSAFTDRGPSESIGNLYYDTLTHGAAALRFLVALVGADHVLFGTDLPFDMTDPTQASAIDALDEEQSRRIWGANAARLLATGRGESLA
jgi:aminocarboxymuconate-semialdehyde decarboxylase